VLQSRTKRNGSVHQAVRRRSDTPRVPERHSRKALQARHERGETKPRLPRDRALEIELEKLEIARSQRLSRLAQAGRRVISRAEKRLLECATDADSKELREAENFRVQRMRTDLERAVLAGSYDDLIRIKQDCEALFASLWQLLRDMKARELVESKDNTFMCPIGMELMRDPVVAADGFTYERRNIEQHFKTHRRGCDSGVRVFDDHGIPSLLLSSELEAIHDAEPSTWMRAFHLEATQFAPLMSRMGSPDATRVRSPMTNGPLKSLELIPNHLVRSKIHQEVDDAAKLLLQRPRTKAMGAEETRDFTYPKDMQDKLLVPMAALQAKNAADEYQLGFIQETLKRYEARESDWKKQLQQQQLSQEHQIGVLMETLKRLKASESDLKKQLQEQQELLERHVAEKSQLHRVHGREKLRLESQLDFLVETLKRSEAREWDLKKPLQEQQELLERHVAEKWQLWQVVQAQAQACEREKPVQAPALVQQSQMQSTTDDEYLRRLSALQKLHTSYLGEVPAGSARTPPWPPARFFELAMEAQNNLSVVRKKRSELQ
jgi:hypothetical protein